MAALGGRLCLRSLPALPALSNSSAGGAGAPRWAAPLGCAAKSARRRLGCRAQAYDTARGRGNVSADDLQRLERLLQQTAEDEAAAGPSCAAEPAHLLAPHHGLLDRLPPQLVAAIRQVPPRTRALIQLNILVLLMSSNWVVVKDVGGSFDPFGFAAMRFLVAAAAFSPFLKVAATDRRVVQAGMELGAWTAAGYLLQSLGLMTTDASRASFLSTFTVLVVPFLAGLGGRGVKPVTWAAAVAALLGVSLLERSGAAPSLGDAWSLLSALAFGVQVFRTEHFSRLLGSKKATSLMSVVLATTAGFSAAAAMAAHPTIAHDMLLHPGHAVAAGAALPWGEVLYTGLLTTDVVLVLELVALRHVSSSEAAIVYTLEPVLGAAAACALLGEHWGGAEAYLGAALILGSSLATQVLGREEGEPVECPSDME